MELEEAWSEQRRTSANRKIYDGLPVRSAQTRILKLLPGRSRNTLRAKLLVVNLIAGEGVTSIGSGEQFDYEAISYHWGRPHNTGCIVINNEPYPIGTSLAGALVRFRSEHHPRYLWADALCINQDNANEKDHQIKNMFQIYQKAKRVLVWLGEHSDYTHSAIKLSKQIVAHIRTRDRSPTAFSIQQHLEQDPYNNDPGWDTDSDFADSDHDDWHAANEQLKWHNLSRNQQNGLLDLCGRPWARRVWCQQEVFAARDLALYCGRYKLGIDEYRVAAKRIDRRSRLVTAPIKISLQAAANWKADSEKVMMDSQRSKRAQRDGTWHFDTQYESDYDLVTVLLKLYHLEATDPKDKIYALLGMSNVSTSAGKSLKHGVSKSRDVKLRIHSSLTHSEVLQDVTRYLLNKHQSLVVLGAHYRRPRDLRHATIPSWTIDWEQLHIDPEATEMRNWNFQVQVPGWPMLAWQHTNDDGSITLHGLVVGTVDKILQPEAGCSLLTLVVTLYLELHHETGLAWKQSGANVVKVHIPKELQPELGGRLLIALVHGYTEPVLLRLNSDGVTHAFVAIFNEPANEDEHWYDWQRDFVAPTRSLLGRKRKIRHGMNVLTELGNQPERLYDIVIY